MPEVSAFNEKPTLRIIIFQYRYDFWFFVCRISKSEPEPLPSRLRHFSHLIVNFAFVARQGKVRSSTNTWSINGLGIIRIKDIANFLLGSREAVLRLFTQNVTSGEA